MRTSALVSSTLVPAALALVPALPGTFPLPDDLPAVEREPRGPEKSEVRPHDRPRARVTMEPRADPSGAPDPEGPGPRRMAITVDDLPLTHSGRHTAGQESTITDRLLATFAEHGVPATGFVNESKLQSGGGSDAADASDEVAGRDGGAAGATGADGAATGAGLDPRRVGLLQRWLDAGLELGNHGYAHLDLHRVEPERWMADVLRGERVTRTLVETAGGKLRWFRHPYLHIGRSAEIQRRTARFLAEHGYRIAPVTVDNGEYIYASAFADAWNRGDEATMERLGTDYVRYMAEVVEFYEGQARQIVGEPIPHILLIHANALNAFWLGPLLDRLEGRGYEWVALEEALRHEAYRRPIDRYTGPGGITWLHRWAITEGLDSRIFRGEPTVPRWVRELAEDGRTSE